MTIEMWVKQEVEIPDSSIPALFAAVNKRFDKETESPVNGEDMIVQAILDDILPDLPIDMEFRVTDAGYYTLDEWLDF